MEIVAVRGKETYIVKISKNKYLLMSSFATDSKPLEAETPDTFLRAGYFEPYNKNEADELFVKSVLKKWGYI